jgi:hypothetical protein
VVAVTPINSAANNKKLFNLYIKVDSDILNPAISGSLIKAKTIMALNQTHTILLN